MIYSDMRDEYNIKPLNPRMNPYVGMTRQPVTTNTAVDEMDDDRFYEELVSDYLEDNSLDKHETISLEEFAAKEEITL